MNELEFEWDELKNLENIRKHGISFDEGKTCFLDPNGIMLKDDGHSVCESRFYWVGESEELGILTVRFTYRSLRLRIIGVARWRKFRRIYIEEKEKRKSEN